MIGAAPTALVLHGEDSSLLTAFAAARTALPSLSLGVDKGEFGEMEFTGIVTNGKELGEAGSLYTYASSGGTYGTPADPDYLAASAWTADWKESALEGTLLESVTINPDLKIEPVKAGSRTLDFRHMGIQFSADVTAAVSLPNLSDIHGDGSFTYGGRNTEASGDLVLTSALGQSLTLKAAAIEKAAMKFAMKEARNRAITFRTSLLTGARIAWA